jgi:uncharacterized protein DUF4202
MVADSGRYTTAIERFDAINARDPNLESDGAAREPKELLYARRMTAMLERFAPDAPEAVRLAVRCQHIRRWEIPRASYPPASEGYKAWRTRLLDHHAEIGAAVLRECGYDEAMVASVASLLRKERLKRNPDAQLLEDVIGLVFMQHYLPDFVARHPSYDEAKFLDILQKTFRKMSPQGRDAAATFVALPPELAAVVAKAAGAADTWPRARS